MLVPCNSVAVAVAVPLIWVSPNADRIWVVSCTVTRDGDRPAGDGHRRGDARAGEDGVGGRACRGGVGGQAGRVRGVQRRRGQRVRAGAGGLLGEVRGVLAGVDRGAAVHDQPGQCQQPDRDRDQVEGDESALAVVRRPTDAARRWEAVAVSGHRVLLASSCRNCSSVELAVAVKVLAPGNPARPSEDRRVMQRTVTVTCPPG